MCPVCGVLVGVQSCMRAQICVTGVACVHECTCYMQVSGKLVRISIVPEDCH